MSRGRIRTGSIRGSARTTDPAHSARPAMAQQIPIAALGDVTFAYPGGNAILRDFSWEVLPGESWAVIGPSGCGKTTLLYILAGLRLPDSGDVTVAGERIEGPRRDIGLILQDHGLLPWETALSNVGLGLRLRGVAGQEWRAEAQSWLDRLGLGELAQRYPRQLSGGQKQRVAIARTLAVTPTLLLMDEPFSALDALTRESFQFLALALGIARGRSAILITHDINEAVMLGNRILIMGHAPGDPATIIDNPGAGRDGYMGSDEFRALAADVRTKLNVNPELSAA